MAQAKEAQQTFTENKILLDDYGNSVKVPAGFKIAEDSAISVTGGVVIEDVSAPGKTSDTKGSQFVWIPVGDVITDTNGSTTKIELGRYTFASNGKETLIQAADNWSSTSYSFAINTCTELTNSSLGNSTAKNLEEYIIKTVSSRGYYIGRYELGDALAINLERNSSSETTNTATCKAKVHPYNYITQLQASSLCREMYADSNFESDLINSYAWDTAIVFIQTFSGDVDYSWQTKLQSIIVKCGEATDGKNKDVRCNIFDMAGNTYEWTTETASHDTYPCVVRGIYGTTIATCLRGGNTASYSNSDYSARPILYL